VSPRAWPKSKGTLTRQGTKRRLAHEAGISLHFYRQAVRVANIPTDEFERLVESTIRLLARRSRTWSPTPRRLCYPPEDKTVPAQRWHREAA
jgi:hypothetical protein